jgi:ATP-dependent Zn protease
MLPCRVKKILQERRNQLEAIARELMQKETLTLSELKGFLDSR